MTTLDAVEFDTPLGTMRGLLSGTVLCDLEVIDLWETRLARLRRRFGRFELRHGPDRTGLAASMATYFDGDVKAIDAIHVDPGGTAFQRDVWRELRTIAAGQTTTYGAFARRLGRPAAARAVGAANGRNPIAVVIPCHRLIAADGNLTGYASGLPNKRWLLAHEGALAGC